MKNKSNAQILGEQGVDILRKSVLEVLYNSTKKNELITPKTISERTGIFRESKIIMKSGNDLIVWGILSSLYKDKLIEARYIKRSPKTGKLYKKPKRAWILKNEKFEAMKIELEK